MVEDKGPLLSNPILHKTPILGENQYLGRDHVVKFLSNGAAVDEDKGMGGGNIRSNIQEIDHCDIHGKCGHLEYGIQRNQ